MKKAKEVKVGCAWGKICGPDRYKWRHNHLIEVKDNSLAGSSLVCIPCYPDYIKHLQKENPEYKVEEQTFLHEEQESSAKRKEDRQQAVRRMHLKTRYGLTPEEYDEMLVKQDDRCANCGKYVERFAPLRVRGKAAFLICRSCKNHPERITIKM